MTRLAAACVDESGHLALVNAGDVEIVSKDSAKEVGEEERHGRMCGQEERRGCVSKLLSWGWALLPYWSCT